MLSDRLRMSLLIAVVCYFVLILLLLKRKSISLKYTLLWMAAGVIMGVMVIWPQTLSYIISIIGIQGNMNGLFILMIAFVIVILMSITAIVSKQSEKIKLLSQTIAMQEKRIRELEGRKR